MDTSPKLCECGCGEPTAIASRNDRRYGWMKGVPVRYVRGHHMRQTPHDYLEDKNGCWIWQRNIIWNGYGMAWNGEKKLLAHRWYYERANGPIPEGMQLDHLCRNRACVNPAHLEVVTRRENARRGATTVLTAGQIAEIRAYKPDVPRYGRVALAERFGVSPATISDIRGGRTWQDVSVPT